LIRLSRLTEAIDLLDTVWKTESGDVPAQTKRVHGTQFADAHRRRAEQNRPLSGAARAEENLLMGLNVPQVAAKAYGWDQQLVGMAVNLLSDGTWLFSYQSLPPTFLEFCDVWDSDNKFVECCRGYRRTLECIRRTPVLRSSLPNLAKAVLSSDHTQRFKGLVRSKFPYFVFVASDEIGDVHWSHNSLVTAIAWEDVSVGRAVSFGVIRYAKGTPAIDLQLQDPGKEEA